VTDPVLIHAGNARNAARKWGIPASVILGILSVEGGTDSQGRPVAPGDGAGPPSFGQFTYGTGAQLGVKYGDSASETDAIGRYLTQLGYQKDPTRAIAAYNGGPGNPQYGYANKVLAAAKHYAGLSGGGAAPSPANGSAGVQATAAPEDSSGAGLFGTTERSGAVRALTYTALTVAGVALAGLGISRTAGLRGSAA
jgi:hypothetical protein